MDKEQAKQELQSVMDNVFTEKHCGVTIKCEMVYNYNEIICQFTCHPSDCMYPTTIKLMIITTHSFRITQELYPRVYFGIFPKVLDRILELSEVILA